MLYGPLAHVERVALDAPPRMLVGGTTGLVSLSEELYRYTEPSEPPCNAAATPRCYGGMYYAPFEQPPISPGGLPSGAAKETRRLGSPGPTIG